MALTPRGDVVRDIDYKGTTAAGPPLLADGGFTVGDWVDSADGSVYLCITSGTPGTWVPLGLAGGSVTTAMLQEDRIKTKGGGREDLVAGGNSGATFTLSLANGNVITLTLSANCTLTFPTVANDGAYSFTLVLTQDGTGSRLVTWPASVKWAGGTVPTLSTAAGKVDVFTFITVNGGTTWLGFAAGLDLR